GTRATTTAFAITSLSSELLKVDGNGSVLEAIADSDYQVPLTFGDGLTRTSNDIDCDTANSTTFGCLSSANWTTFNNKWDLASATIAVPYGGTGATTLTDGGVLLGSGTGAITPMGVLADGSIIVGDGTTDPVALAAFESSTGDLSVTAGGSGVGTLTGMLKGNGTSDFTGITGVTSLVARWTDANTIGTGILFDNNTNVGVSTSTPWAKLSIGTVNQAINSPAFAIGSSSTGVATTSTFEVYSNGKAGLGIGTSTTGQWATLAVNPVAGAFNNRFAVGSSSATSFLIDNSGHIFMPQLTTDAAAHTYTMCGAATTFEAIWDTTTCVLSAAKYKTNIEDLDIGLTELLKVRPVSFNWKPTGDPTYDNDINTKHNQIGVIANEIESLDSRLVTYDNTGEIKGFRYDFFTAWITKAVQEMWGEVVNLIDWNKDQERRIKALEDENELLKVRLEKLENKR
ncbi:MAG: tail fiber domain-containing protein, partial [Candidatus Levybacteria bacterium]|nr:tail fiber domain-containing protein [Candidatus Levybacteria bacterium]